MLMYTEHLCPVCIHSLRKQIHLTDGEAKAGRNSCFKNDLEGGCRMPALRCRLSFLCTVFLDRTGCQVRYWSACAQIERWWNVADSPRVFPRVRV